jgi:hypothetical protein
MNDGGLKTNATQLIGKLIEIGKAARQDAPMVRPLVIQAEDYALRLQRDVVALLHENEELRSQLLR